MKHWISQYASKAIVLPLSGHFALVGLTYVLCAHFLSGMLMPNDQNLITWDAYWYNTIKDFGYVFIPYERCNMAFFPLFPVAWDMLRVDALQISILNGFVFGVSFIFLMGNKRENIGYMLALVSVPSFIFFFVPFSESCFFLFGTILLLGYARANQWMIVIGLLGACLTRSVAIVFIPALVITHFICSDWSRKKIADLLLLVAMPVICVLCVVLIQAKQTGQWFYFIEVQKYWNRHFHVPILPFDILGADRMSGIDTAALLMGFIGAYFCIEWAIVRIRNYTRGVTNPVDVPVAVVFSALYLAGINFANSFMSFEVSSGTVLMSLNRYIFATPFFIVFIHWLVTHDALPRRSHLIMLGITLATFLSTALWRQPVSAMLYYIAFAVLFPLVSLFRLKFTAAYIMIYIVHIILQVMLFNDLLHVKWVG